MLSSLYLLQQKVNRLRPYFSQPAAAWIVGLLALVAVSLSEPLLPALLKPLLDKGFSSNSFSIWVVPAALLGLFGLRGLASFVAQAALSKVATTSMANLRAHIFKVLMRADFAMFREQSSSSLSNTVVLEVQNGVHLLVHSAISLVRDFLTLLALVAYLLYLNWQLSLIIALVLPAVAWAVKLYTRRTYRLSKSAQLAIDKLAYVVEENVLARKDIRIHGAQAAQTQRFDAINQELMKLSMKSAVAGAAITPITQMLAAVALSAVISVALVQSSGSGVTVGEFASFITAMLMLIAPIKHLSEVSGPITRGLTSIERVLDLIDHTQEEHGGASNATNSTGLIEFSNVTMQYPDATSPTIKGLTLQIPAGKNLALVGLSGSGKSSLVALLPRFISNYQGYIYINGLELRQWDLQALRQQFSYVGQETVMLNDTIAANVALGQTLDRERVIACLQAAHLGAHVDSLVHGIDTVLGHNAQSLSGGQKQRLAIARALYKDAPIVILDEATSALDSESEFAVQAALASLTIGRTTIAIAHRLSTIQNADTIVVMDSGKIIESGSHASLLEAGGVYANLQKIANKS